MITCYQKGYKREMDLIKRLRKMGKFHTVLRSAGSHSHFDIVAISKSKILLLQVKSGKGKLRGKIKRLRRIKVPSCAKKQLWVYQKGWKMVLDI